MNYDGMPRLNGHHVQSLHIPNDFTRDEYARVLMYSGYAKSMDDKIVDVYDELVELSKNPNRKVKVVMGDKRDILCRNCPKKARCFDISKRKSIIPDMGVLEDLGFRDEIPLWEMGPGGKLVDVEYDWDAIGSEEYVSTVGYLMDATRDDYKEDVFQIMNKLLEKCA